ncbi:uncharacterized protein EI90DRAFT_3069896, partial [Cantharellus anzutake]|uniref:uncharacterized protein n=1 Tax=Cantharellus anzutake TaxID=1750568 RepID=UPI001906481A
CNGIQEPASVRNGNEPTGEDKALPDVHLPTCTGPRVFESVFILRSHRGSFASLATCIGLLTQGRNEPMSKAFRKH